MEFLNDTLENGLTVVAEVNPQAASMAMGFFVRAGSRDEAPEVAGVSHFLEHMVFKGTETRTGLDVNREFDQLGANYNAATSEESTIYWGGVLPEYQGRLLGLLADILRPSLRDGDFETEKQVILEEIALYEDDPYFRLYDAMMAQHFKDHPLGNMILGTNASISPMTAGQMRTYFDTHYTAGNISLIATGNLDYDKFLAEARKFCGHWPAGRCRRSTPESRTRQSREARTDPKLMRQHIALSSWAPDARDERRYAAHLLAAVLGDASSSRLYYALVDPGLADCANMTYRPMDHTGMYMTTISCPAEDPAKVLEIARDEIARLVADGPTEGELQAAKNKIASRGTLKGEIPMGRLSAVGSDWVYAGRYEPLAEKIERIFAVTPPEVHELARAARVDQMDVCTLGPADDFLH